MMELLSPAGNPEKLRAAFNYGADAVYIGGNTFSMRAAADNFSIDEIFAACAYAHRLGKKVYITVNTQPRDDEYPALVGFLDSLRGSGADALIVTDLGVAAQARRILPGTELHLSTQAGAVSAASCEEYLRLGFTRAVLARELSIEDIRSIRSRVSREMTLEVFVHGSMCVSFSGRCLLSNHFTGRDANRGMCTQPCRWDYELFGLRERERPDEMLEIEETPLGSFIMSSRDLCAAPLLPQMIDAGVGSFKIEGRMKSVYYTAVTANTYRMMLDAAAADPNGYSFLPVWQRELESVSHREYCTGYLADMPSDNAQTVTRPGYIHDNAFLAEATDGAPAGGTARFEQRNKFSSGDTVELLSPGKCGRSFIASDMTVEDGSIISSTPHPKMKFGMTVPFEVKPGDIIRRIIYGTAEM